VIKKDKTVAKIYLILTEKEIILNAEQVNK